MSKIFISYFNGIRIDEQAMPVFYDAFIHGLEQAGTIEFLPILKEFASPKENSYSVSQKEIMQKQILRKMNLKTKIRYKIWKHLNKKLKKKGII